MVICLEQGADLHTAQLLPLPLTVSYFSTFNESGQSVAASAINLIDIGEQLNAE